MKPNLDQIIKANAILIDRAIPRLKVTEPTKNYEGLDLNVIPTDQLLKAMGYDSIEDVVFEDVDKPVQDAPSPANPPQAEPVHEDREPTIPRLVRWC